MLLAITFELMSSGILRLISRHTGIVSWEKAAIVFVGAGGRRGPKKSLAPVDDRE